MSDNHKKAVNDAFDTVSKCLDKLLDGVSGPDHSGLLILQGALHAIFYKIQDKAPSGLFSTQFIINELNMILTHQVELHMEEAREELEMEEEPVSKALH